MKLCFSTLGCSDCKLNEVYAAAKDLNIKGIEIRRLENIGYVPDMKAFSDEKLAETTTMLNDGGIKIPLLASHAVFGKKELAERAESEIKAYCETASKLGTEYIKISLNKEPNDFTIDEPTALDTVRKLCKTAKEYGITLLIMTNAVFSDTALLKSFIEKADCDNLFALWDVNYTYRFANERPEKTIETLGALIKFVHLKDSIGEDKQIIFRPLGTGDVPLKDAIRLLYSNGYDGYLSVEWKKSWGEEFLVAGIVLSHFVTFVARTIKQ